MKLRERLSRGLKRLSNWWKRRSPGNRHSCLKCGFLSVNRREADTDARIVISARGAAGWFTKETLVDCNRGLWFWDVDGAETIISEGNKHRFRCEGFRHHTPGRSPEWHLEQEDKDREFKQKLILTIVPVLVPPVVALFGNLFGGAKLAWSAGAIALIGAVVALFGLRHR